MQNKMIVVNKNFSEIEVVRGNKSRFYFYSHRIHALIVGAHGLEHCHGKDSYGNSGCSLFVTTEQYDRKGFAL